MKIRSFHPPMHIVKSICCLSIRDKPPLLATAGKRQGASILIGVPQTLYTQPIYDTYDATCNIYIHIHTITRKKRYTLAAPDRQGKLILRHSFNINQINSPTGMAGKSNLYNLPGDRKSKQGFQLLTDIL